MEAREDSQATGPSSSQFLFLRAIVPETTPPKPCFPGLPPTPKSALRSPVGELKLAHCPG